MTSPADLEDFVVGSSLANGFVESLDDITDIRLHGSGAQRAEIGHRQPRVLAPQKRTPPATRQQQLRALRSRSAGTSRSCRQRHCRPHWLQDLRQRIEAFQPLGRDCGAVHAALFMDANGEIHLGREDIRTA